MWIQCCRSPLLFLDLIVRVLLVAQPLAFRWQPLILRGLKLPRRLCLVVVLDKGVFHTFHTCMLCPHIYIYYMHDKEKLWQYYMHDKKSCGILQPNASRTMLVYCCRSDTPGRASFSSLSSDASASTFAGRRDAVYGARRSVSGSSRKACEWCVTLLDLCLFGLQLKHSRRCEWTCTRILFGAFISWCLRVGCNSNTIARCQWTFCPCSNVIQPF